MDMNELILDTLDDLISDFLYYDRKDDEELSADDLKNAIKNEDVTVDEMFEYFKDKLNESINVNPLRCPTITIGDRGVMYSKEQGILLTKTALFRIKNIKS